MTVFAQVFCTLKDIFSDQEAAGGDLTRWYQSVCEASDYLQKEIGKFIPITRTASLNGKGGRLLFIPPLLSVSSIVNDGTTLALTDYVLNPDGAHWLNGPYSWLEVDPDASNLSTWVDEADGVQIAGRWGLYERVASTGATVQDTTQQSDSQLTLKVSDGGSVSPGMVLKLGDEQELVTGLSAPTTAVTALSGAVAISDEQITVDDASLVNIGETIRVNFEQMLVLDKNETTEKLSVMRGLNRTQRAAHADNDALDVYRTFTVERGVNGTTAAVHANGLAISRYTVPDDILFLTRQIAVLMMNKAKSGYAGRTGNEQTGTVFYNDAFPRFDIDRIKNKYRIPRAQ